MPLPVSHYTVYASGDQAMTLSLGNSITAGSHHRIVTMRHWVESNLFDGLKDCIAAYSSLTIIYDVSAMRRSLKTEHAGAFVHDYLVRAYHNSGSIGSGNDGRVVRIPVCYDDVFAPDMEDVCRLRGLTREAVIALHTGRTYRVYMVGFLPGFAYLAEVDERLATGRRQQPRPRVEAGSIGVAGIQTGIYPVASPGGWQIIGRTPVAMFTPTADPPVLLAAGDEVCFYSIDRVAYDDIKQQRQ